LASLTNGSNPAYSTTYDASGNIRTITEGSTLKAEYTYDTMNQLIREDSAYSEKSIDYTYDVGGNITSKTIYAYTGGVRGALEDTIVCGYTDAWKDKLTSYDGQSLSYDAIGNPTTYRDNLSFTWANGRELATVINDGVNGSFTYNDSGIRTSKTYNGVTTSYLLNGSSIVRQTQGESILDFFYDENGNLYGFQKGTSTYYYLRNGQNDIVGILDSTGTQVVSYTYDAWGNQEPISGTLATTIGQENPFRYRGYYFDTETGLYYLNSRYYDSVTGRFINADGLISASSTLLGTNMYAYCENNPINRLDENGQWSIFATIGVAVGVTLAVAAITVLTCGVGTATLVGSIAVGAAKGALIGAAIGTTAGAGIGYAVTGSVDGAIEGAAIGFGAGAVVGAVVGGVGAYSSYSKAASFISENGKSATEVLKSFKGTPKLETLKIDTTVYRSWGGKAREISNWISPNNYGASARSLLSIPEGNTMEYLSTFVLSKGTQVLSGIAAPMYDQIGGGVQWWLP
jgi:RHS repeat-associated protein